jgi:hypothetical protein
VLQAVLAGEQGTGLADKVVGIAVAVRGAGWSGILTIPTICSSTDGSSTEAHRRRTSDGCTINATAIDAGTGYATAIDAGASNASVMNAAASNGSAASSIGEGVSCNSHNTRDADEHGCRK